MTYPFRWLWDSCFHSIIWLALGDADRAVTELAFTLSVQEPDGFVPHVHYVADPGHHAVVLGAAAGVDDLASRRSPATPSPCWSGPASTCPARCGSGPSGRCRGGGASVATAPGSSPCATRGRRAATTRARFDHWGAADRARWFDVKGSLVAAGGAGFDCAPVGLAALVAWDARELGLDPPAGLVDAIASRWDGELGTWVDAGDAAATSGRTRTLEGLLPLLVDRRSDVPIDDYLAPFGPRGMHPDEPAYEPSRYWRGGRGPSWPTCCGGPA